MLPFRATVRLDGGERWLLTSANADDDAAADVVPFVPFICKLVLKLEE